VTPPETVRRTDPYLIAPSIGYQQAFDPAAAAALEEGWRELVRGGSPAAALTVAQQYARRDGAGAPAAVLAAQSDYLEGLCERAIGRLEAVVQDLPSYTAAQLMLGRCAEEVVDLPLAASAYSAISAVDTLAGARLAAIGPAARDAAVIEIRTSIASGRRDDAKRALTVMQSWAPADEGTLEAVKDLAAELGDGLLELQVVRALVQGGRGDRWLVERQAALEMEIGDAGAGLKILEDLRRQHPEDREISEQLERARFAWRLTMLPEPARELVENPELDRGQLAALFYWVFPGVRYGRPKEAVIANDVLDHEHRTEIVRVVNLGIMEIDPNLHAFRPDEPAERLDALRGLLRVLDDSGQENQCFEGATVASALTLESICSLVARCGLVPEPGDCLPKATLSGAAAMALARNAALNMEQE